MLLKKLVTILNTGVKKDTQVAILSKEKPIKTVKGFKNDKPEDQKRFIECTFATKESEITIMNGYFPQGENINHETKFPKKIKYYDDLKTYQGSAKTKENLVVMGDFNVAPEDIDIELVLKMLRDGCVMVRHLFNHKNEKCGTKAKNLGFMDSWRIQNPNESTIYSWFDYRSRMFDDNPKRGLGLIT